jgi:Ca2+:H+ antiporter
MNLKLRPSLWWLLVCVPIAALLERLAPERQPWIFGVSCLAIVPLAGLMGRATEQLAERAGEGIGGLLSGTFGNAAEMIIAAMALRRGLIPVVKASLTGSIVGNVLLVLGVSVLSGGLRHPHQRFNATAARSQATMLILAAIGLIAPAAFHHLAGRGGLLAEGRLSLDISLVLLATYVCGLLFSLVTHRSLFAGETDPAHRSHRAVAGRPWPLSRALGTLLVATALIAWMSEILVGAVEETARALGMTDVFVGVIVVAIVGNAAENSTAVLAALRNRMDLSVAIAVGSSVQIAIFVAPILVLLSYAIAPRPMDLVFTVPEVLAVTLAVAVASQIAGDGESNWLEGAQLLAVYAILGLVFFFLPA